MKHTPGPWILKRNRVTISVIASSTGNYITENIRAQPNQEANARLIAAAPELLEACKRAALCWVGNPSRELSPAAYQSLLDAIAKAEGAE